MPFLDFYKTTFEDNVLYSKLDSPENVENITNVNPFKL